MSAALIVAHPSKYWRWDDKNRSAWHQLSQRNQMNLQWWER